MKMPKKNDELKEKDERAVARLRQALRPNPRGLIATPLVMALVQRSDSSDRPPRGARVRRLMIEAFPYAQKPRMLTVRAGVRGRYWGGVALRTNPLVRPVPRKRKPGEYSIRLRGSPTEKRGKKRYR